MLPCRRSRAHYDGLKLAVTAAADGERNASLALVALSRDQHVVQADVRQLSSGDSTHCRSIRLINGSKQPAACANRQHRARVSRKRIIDVDDREIALGKAPGSFGAAVFDEGDVTALLSDGQMPPHTSVADPQRAASAALEYDFELQPGESRDWVLAVPFARDQRPY